MKQYRIKLHIQYLSTGEMFYRIKTIQANGTLRATQKAVSSVKRDISGCRVVSSVILKG